MAVWVTQVCLTVSVNYHQKFAGNLTYHDSLFIFYILETHALDLTDLIFRGMLENFDHEYWGKFVIFKIHHIINSTCLRFQIFVLAQRNGTLGSFAKNLQDFDLIDWFWLLIACTQRFVHDFLISTIRTGFSFAVYLFVVNRAFASDDFLRTNWTCFIFRSLLFKICRFYVNQLEAFVWWTVNITVWRFALFEHLYAVNASRAIRWQLVG